MSTQPLMFLVVQARDGDTSVSGAAIICAPFAITI
jgi:hypothetical protein